MATTTEEALDFTLEDDEKINVVLLSEAILVAAIFFTVATFYYSKKSENIALQFNFCYKILAIILVFATFFLLFTGITNSKKGVDTVGTITFALIIIAIVIANVIGMTDYKYSCWNKCCSKVFNFSPNKCCKIVYYIAVGVVTIILLFFTCQPNDVGQTVENALWVGFCLSLLLSIFNALSLIMVISILFSLFCSLIYFVVLVDATKNVANKFLLYSFPIIFIICIFYGIVCCRKPKVYLREHVGYNVLCGLLSILNRASNVVVFFIWLSTKTAGLTAVFQIFLIIFTAVISTISVQYNPPQNNKADAVVLDDDENDSEKIKKYFCLGKIYTFLGWGRIWFEAVSWDKNTSRDSIINGYHAIKIYELIFECFPSLALQIIVCITIFVHETVIVSIIICICYVTLILLGIVYDELYPPIELIEAKGKIVIDRVISVSCDPAVTIQAPRAGSSTNGPAVTVDGVGIGGAEYGSVQQDLEMDIDGNMQKVDAKLKFKNCCSTFGFMVFIWSDFLIRIIPLWVLTRQGAIVVVYVIVLFFFDMILYWRMVLKGKGLRLNKCVDILLFGWTGIISCSYYLLSTMNIKYVSSVGDKKSLLVELWLRILLNLIVVLVANNYMTEVLAVIFICSLLSNLISGCKLLFGCCCRCKNGVAHEAQQQHQDV